MEDNCDDNQSLTPKQQPLPDYDSIKIICENENDLSRTQTQE